MIDTFGDMDIPAHKVGDIVKCTVKIRKWFNTVDKDLISEIISINNGNCVIKDIITKEERVVPKSQIYGVSKDEAREYKISNILN